MCIPLWLLSLYLCSVSLLSLHTHTVHGHGFQAINTLAFIYAYLHASGSPWATSGNLTSSAFCHPVPAILVNIASVSGSRCLGPLISTLAPCLSGVIAGYYQGTVRIRALSDPPNSFKELRTTGSWITGTFCLFQYVLRRV